MTDHKNKQKPQLIMITRMKKNTILQKIFYCKYINKLEYQKKNTLHG